MNITDMDTSDLSTFSDDETSLHCCAPGSRRKARELALQGLYAVEMTGHSVDVVMRDLFSFHEKDDSVIEFTRGHIERTHEHQIEIDAYIRKYAANWDFERITTIDRIILRMAICEFLHFWDIPPKVSIDEAIELSKSYSTDQSSRFVNGILDAVLLDIKEHQLLIKVGRGLHEGEESEGIAKPD